jgi:hypothetical protein
VSQLSSKGASHWLEEPRWGCGVLLLERTTAHWEARRTVKRIKPPASIGIAHIHNSSAMAISKVTQIKWSHVFFSNMDPIRRQNLVLATAPVATADAADTRPGRAGIAAHPFRYHVLESTRAIVFDRYRATSAGIAIVPHRATVRC